MDIVIAHVSDGRVIYYKNAAAFIKRNPDVVLDYHVPIIEEWWDFGNVNLGACLEFGKNGGLFAVDKDVCEEMVDSVVSRINARDVVVNG